MINQVYLSPFYFAFLPSLFHFKKSFLNTKKVWKIRKTNCRFNTQIVNCKRITSVQMAWLYKASVSSRYIKSIFKLFL